MAFLATALSAAELAALAADKPMFLGRNVLENYVALPQWRISNVWSTGSDFTSASFPTRWGFDGQGHVRTLPSISVGSATYSYLMNLTAGTTNAYSFDTVVIWNHNFDTLESATTVQLEIANASDFGASQGDPTAGPAYLTVLVAWTGITTASRLVSKLTSRYTSAQYLRLRITTTAGGGFVTLPAFGELILARRYQLSVFPETPWVPKRLVSDLTQFKAHAGSSATYTRSYGKRVFDPPPRFVSGGSVESAAGLSVETEMSAWWSAVQCGKRPFVFFPQPTTAGSDAIICKTDENADLTVAKLGPNEREIAPSPFHEVAPFRQLEVE